jgi:protein-tyrosine-phosphatase/predicted ATP-grasp superfamily ATP-dependent carboligase
MKLGTNGRPVLILGGYARVSVPMARSLHYRCGVPVEVAHLSDRDPRVSSRAIRDSISLPDFQEAPAEFIGTLSSLIRERQFDTLIPVQDDALAAIAQHYDVLSSMVHVACPPPHIVERVLNKELTLATAQQCGVPVPRSYTFSSAMGLESLSAELTFPVVMKPSRRGGQRSFKAHYLHNLAELREAVANNLAGEVLLQEYCPGNGIGIEMLIHNGECLATFQHRRLKEEPASGGVAVMAIAEKPDPELADASLKLLRALEWEGVAMVEFRKNPMNGAAVLMEVNGRYWGTVSLPIRAGMDFPVFQWRLLHGQDPQIPSSYPVGIRWRWTAGYISRLHGLFLRSAERVGSQPSKFRELLLAPLDLSPWIRDAMWSFRDPRPAITELAQTIVEWSIADLKAIVKKILPAQSLSDVQEYRSFGHRQRAVYLKLRLLESLGLRHQSRRRVPSGARSFVFVCHGNIIRSPMAEAMLKRCRATSGSAPLSIISAGLHARPGNNADPRARAAAAEFGVSLEEHRAQPLTQEMVNHADVIFAMDFRNLVELLAQFPKAKKIFMLSNYGQSEQREIPDPYFGDQDEVRRCYKTVEICIRNLAASLDKSPMCEGNKFAVTPAVGHEESKYVKAPE